MSKQKTVYDIIKGQNGEHFARAVRDNGLLDIPNLPAVVKYAGRDAEPILNYLESLKDIKIKDQPVHGDPIELLARAGYDAYVADTLKKQNAIKKYFAPGEELCTFKDEDRYKNYYIINAVRHDLDKIVRPAHPSRQDEYGTSVLSIQILKSGGRISIKNRYNHTVENPDNTFGSNPDNIIAGLSDALRAYFNVDFSANCEELPDGYTIVRHQIVKYNQEIDNIYYGADFYVKQGKIIKLDNATQLFLGNELLLNLQDKRVYVWDKDGNPTARHINKVIKNRKLSVTKAKDGTKSVFADGTHVLDVKNGLMNWCMPLRGNELDLRNLQLSGDWDFSGIRRTVELTGADLQNVTSMKFDGRVLGIYLRQAKGLHGKLDFSYAQVVDLADTDFKNVKSVNFGQHAIYASLGCSDNINCELDFSNVDQVVLYYADLSNVPCIKFKKSGGEINLNNVTGLSGNLVLPAKAKVSLNNVDLGAVTSIKFGAGSIVYLRNTKNLSCPLDLSEVTEFDSMYSDFSKVPLFKFNPHAKFIDLGYTTGLSGNLNFGNVSSLYLIDANLYRVTGINFNPNGEIIGLSEKSCNEWTARFMAAQKNNINTLACIGRTK